MKKRLFLTIFTLLLLLALSVQFVSGHNGRGYSYETSSGTNNPDWMGDLSDSLLISELSLPGTHDTMTFLPVPIPVVELWIRTQSMPLSTQLNAGIRVLDIRARYVNDVFYMYHGIPLFAEISELGDFGRKAVFGQDVLDPINQFLEAHPDEVIFMRLGEDGGPAGGNTFQDTLQTYVDGPHGVNIWSPYSPIPGGGGYNVTNNPTLGDVRGKIVILQSDPAWEDTNGNNFGLLVEDFTE